MQTIAVVGLDLAKTVFQVHGVGADGTVVVRRQLRRGQVLGFFQSIGGVAQPHAARVLPDGSLDTTLQVSSDTGLFTTVALTADGAWLGGDMAQVGGSASGRLVKLDHRGRRWISGPARELLLRQPDGTSLTILPPGSGVSSLTEDHEGNIWVALESGGLRCLRERRVVTTRSRTKSVRS